MKQRIIYLIFLYSIVLVSINAQNLVIDSFLYRYHNQAIENSYALNSISSLNKYSSKLGRNFEVELKSTYKGAETIIELSSELLGGTLVGIGGSILVMDYFDRKNNLDALSLFVFEAASISFVAILGSNVGVHAVGKLFGKSGSFRNSIVWSIVIGGITAFITSQLYESTRSNLWSHLIGIPIGATFGFNTRDIFN